MLVYFVVCDECGLEGAIVFTNFQADIWAKDNGWVQISNQHYCPEHKKPNEGFAPVVKQTNARGRNSSE
jgi:hypothetical protein